jgi:hypothetical protein
VRAGVRAVRVKTPDEKQQALASWALWKAGPAGDSWQWREATPQAAGSRTCQCSESPVIAAKNAR